MPDITGLILAGGQGRRMGGVDKGLVPLRGRPMVAWVLERLSPQVDEVLICANRNLDHYRALGCPVVSDSVFDGAGGFAGPLAGLHAGLRDARHSHVLTVPCDSPFLPADLGARLLEPCLTLGADLAVARTGNQPHPVFSLCRRSLLTHLTDFLASGGRKIDAWYASLKVIEVSFDDEPEAFSNINTPDELGAFDTGDFGA